MCSGRKCGSRAEYALLSPVRAQVQPAVVVDQGKSDLIEPSLPPEDIPGEIGVFSEINGSVKAEANDVERYLVPEHPKGPSRGCHFLARPTLDNHSQYLAVFPLKNTE